MAPGFVILLDTNYLIRALIAGTQEADAVSAWLSDGQELCTSSIAWFEFLSGPVDQEGIELIGEVIRHAVMPFDAVTAREAARLFNAAGRNRRLRVDAMIAASATLSASLLATANVDDFRPFMPQGLKLVAI